MQNLMYFSIRQDGFAAAADCIFGDSIGRKMQ